MSRRARRRTRWARRSTLSEKRLLLINYEYPPLGAGAANATRYIAEALVALGHEVTVVTAAFGELQGTRLENGVEVIRIPARRADANRSNMKEMASYMWSLMWRLPAVLKSRQFDAAIIFFSIPCGPIGLYLRLFQKIPYLVLLRGGDVPGTETALENFYYWLTPLRRLVLKQARAVAANSRGLAELSMKADPILVEVIPNGVDTDYWQPGGQSAEDVFRVLFVGRLHEQKNISWLLQSIAGLDGEVRLTVVGEGPLETELEKKARQLDVDATFVGWLDSDALKAVYQQADCLVNPSHYEGMPNVVMEAMSCGVPVIVSDCAGNAELVEHEKTGLISPLSAPGSLEANLRRLQGAVEERRELGEQARRAMLESYNWQASAQRYLELLER